jgi:3-deoxy-manno-octulosonate cytidylyltransferase (CMP-KDO synthetase)
VKFLGVIPARYASTRLEGKPLKDICGHTMIEWVYKRAIKSGLDKVIVATDDDRILKEVERFNGEAALTSRDHPNGTSRIAEVCEKYNDFDVIINIQGDEPLIEPQMINQLIETFLFDKDLVMSTIKNKIDDMEDIKNPNVVKVITDKNDFAIYFSRSIIPYPRNENLNNYYKHVGIYGYKREFVIEYSKMISTPLELSESLEQLRVLENGYKIKVIDTPHKIIGVDTEDELNKVREYISNKKIKI